MAGLQGQPEEYDLLILGSGAGSKLLAWTFAKRGQRVAVVERKYDSRVVRDNMSGGNRVTTGRQVPFCLLTDPEFARVGMTEKEAKANGIAYRLFKVPMTAVLRARSLMETRGFLKCLVKPDSDRSLGFAAFGVGTGKIMGCVQIAMLGGMPYTALREAVLARPTIPEGLLSLFSFGAP